MLEQFQREAATTFKEHVPLNAYQARLLNWGIGLGGESGEVLELLKHHIYAEEDINRMELAKELGDVLWYVSAIAETTGLHMVDIAELNLAKLQHRYYTGAYTDEEAQSRHERETLFTDTPIYKVLRARIDKTPAPMNVIFVGPDGSGKTTLAKKVAERMGFNYHKCDYRQEDKPALAKQLLDDQINVIYDRFYWPDDALYCTVKKIEQSTEYWARYEDVINALQRLNTLYIFVTCSKDELIARSKVWADDYIKTEQLDAIIENYNNWWRYVEQLHISTCKMDTTGVKLDSPEFDSLIEGCCQAIIAGQEVYARINNKEEE